MTRTHAARQLLALGPLSFGQFAEIMGGSIESCRRVLSYLVDDTGEAQRLARLYSLTHGNQLPDMPELEAEGKPIDGSASVRPVCAGPAVVIPSADADLRETQARCAGCGRCSCGLGGEGVKA